MKAITIIKSNSKNYRIFIFSVAVIISLTANLSLWSQPSCGNVNMGTISPSCGNWNTASYSAGTMPYWSFPATAGCSYQFSLCPHSGGTEDSYLHLYDASYNEVWTADDNGIFSYCSAVEASGTWTCTTSGTYYISASHYSCSNINYAGSLSYMYFQGPLNSLGTITPSTSWQNANYSAGEISYWTFSATGGAIYDFSFCANSEDSYLRIYDNSWTQVASADDYGVHCSGSVAASINWTAPSSGTFYIVGNHYSCSGWQNASYLQYKYQSSCTTPGTPTSLSGSGTGTTTASLSWAAGSPAGSATVTYYWDLYTSGGTSVTSGNTTGTSASVSGLTCGTSYYFTVYAYTNCNGSSSSAATSGIFSTTACPVPGCGDTNMGTISFSSCSPQDVSYTSGTIPYWIFTANAGTTYNFTLGGQNSEDSYLHLYDSGLTEVASNDDYGPFYAGTPSSLSYTCSVSGTYYITACHYTCSAFSNSSYMNYWSTNSPYGSSGLTTITPATSWQNEAYSSGSMYLYQFAATAGIVYDFSLCDNSEDSYLRIYNSTYDLQFSNDDSGPWCTGLPSSASWTAPSSANYIIEISHLGCSGFTNSGNLAYKYVDPCTTPGIPASLSGSGTGTTTASLSWAAGSPGGSATVTYYWNLYTSGGTSVTSGNTTGTSATVSGLTCGTSYYFTVYAYTNCNGSSSSAATSGIFSTTACPVPGCGDTNMGTISFSSCSPQDVSYTSGTIPYWIFTANAGTTYNFTLGGQNSEDSYLHLYDSGLTEVASNDDYGPFYAGTPSSLSYTCSVSGTYYITACHYTCAAFSNSSYMTYWSTNSPYGSSVLTTITPTTSWQNEAYSSGSIYLYEFAATAGTVYDFSLCDNSEDSYLRIYNSTYDELFANDDSGPWCTGLPSSASWTAPSSDNYIIEISLLGCSGFTNSGNLAYKYVSSCTNPEAMGQWTGCTSSDWNTSTNWGQNTVPASGTDVVIPSGPGNQPVISAASVCNNITINSGATLTVSGSSTLTVNGNWTNNGTFAPGTGTVIYNGSDQTIYGNTNFWFVRFSGSGTKTLSTGTFQTNNSSDATFGSPDMIIASGAILSVPAGVTWSTMAPYGVQVSGTLNISGGTFNCSATNGYGISPDNDSWLTGSVLNISSGLFHGSIDANFNDATINLSGGSIEIDDDIWGSGTLNQSGGTYRNTTSGGQFILNGGSLTGGTIIAYSNGSDRGLGIYGTTTATSSHTTILDGSLATNIPRINADVELGNVQVNNTSNLYISSGSLRVAGNLTINASKVFNAQSYNFAIAGNWTNNGTYTPGTNTVTFDGTSGSSTITAGGTGAGKQFYNITVNSSNIVDLYGNVQINNDFTISNANQFNCQSYVMSVGGNWTRTGGQFNRGTGTVNLTGTGKNIAGIETIFRNLNISGTYTHTATVLTCMRTSGTGGDLNITGGASLTAQANQIKIEGNWTNAGLFTPATSTVTFNGTLLQGIASGGSSFYNVIFNNSATGTNDINVSSPMLINANATFNNGIVYYSGTGSLTFGNSASTTVSNNNSFVNGLVTKTGASAFVFPTGDVTTRDLGNGSTTYNVLGALGVNPDPSATIVTAEYFYSNADGMPDWWEHGGNMDATLHHVSDREHWLLNSDKDISNTTLYWYDNAHLSGICIHGFDDGVPADFDPQDLAVAYWSGTLWRNAGGNASGQAHDQGFITSGLTIPFGAKAQTFVTFGSKNDIDPLPVELTSFSAKCDNQASLLSWQTASETNNDFYIVEKSNDMINFFEIGKIYGAGNSSRILNYSFTDKELLSGDNYYRLKQVDFDGKTTTYGAIAVNCDAEVMPEPAMIAYPNPFTDELNVIIENSGDNDFVLEIFDDLGKLVYSKEFSSEEATFHTILEIKNLRPAVYNLRSRSNGNVMNMKVVKK